MEAIQERRKEIKEGKKRKGERERERDKSEKGE